MSYKRNLNHFVRKRIIYRRSPIKDKPTESFEWGNFYEEGTYECYELFRGKAKITTFKSLKWHLLVLWYLNPKLSQDELEYLAMYMCNKNNGFTTFNVNTHAIKNIVYEVSMCDLEQPPTNKLRKIIFYDTCLLSPKEKMVIVGQLIGRSKQIHKDDIYHVMLDIHDANKKITVAAIAKALGCTTRTIYRNIGNELKKEKELLNKEL